MAFTAPTGTATAAAYGLGLVMTLALAGVFTPRRWWRRPTAGNLAVTGGGALGLGILFCALFAALMPGMAPAPALAHLAAPPAAALPPPAMHAVPGQGFRVVDDLNLRSGKAIGARRVAVLPAGSLVTATGAIDGDWWQVRARLQGKQVEGWASSLWLRRVDEHAGG